MENITRRSFNVNLVTLRLLGLYPSKQHSMLYSVYGYVMVTCCMLPYPILSVMYYVKHEELSVMDAGFNFFIIIGMLCYYPKILPFIADNENIRECLYFVETSMRVKLSVRQKTIVEDGVWVCKRNSTFFLVCLILDSVSWICRPLLMSQEEFSMELWLPFDPTTNTFLFYTTYVFMAVGVVYTIVACGAVDPLIAGLAYLAAGQIQVLKDNLQFPHENVDQNSVYKSIHQCIQHHNIIISYINKIEECFSWSLSFQFIGSIGIICFCCLELSRLELASLNSVLMTTYLLCVTLEIYFYCYYGTTIYEESKSLVTSVYMGRWYEYDLRTQKALLVFMERAKIPESVRVAKVFHLNLGTFAEILKKSYSLLAVLNK